MKEKEVKGTIKMLISTPIAINNGNKKFTLLWKCFESIKQFDNTFVLWNYLMLSKFLSHSTSLSKSIETGVLT